MASKVIGLTGGIGCGKSEVARIMELSGDAVIDADAIGRQVVEGNPNVLQRLWETFGHEFRRPDGSLDRKKLGDFVFASQERTAQLNAIVHPELWKRCLTMIDRARSDGAPIIVVDAALIYEVGLEKEVDGVVVVTSTLEHRLARVMKRDDVSEEAVRLRMAAQMPLEEKEKRATWLIRNDGTLDELNEQVRRLRTLILSGG